MNDNKILVIAPSWVGDLVMSHALLRLIKSKNPKCSIDVLALPSLHPILRRMREVDNYLVSPFKHGELKLIERFNLAKRLRKNFYTHAYVLPNTFKSALMPFFARISYRIGWCGEGRFLLLNDIRFFQKKLSLMVERYVALGHKKHEKMSSHFLLPKLEALSKQRDLVLKRLQVSLNGRPILAICPGAEYGATKRWPIKYFAKIAEAKKHEGWEIWIFGGAKESALACKIQEQCKGVCLDLTGKTDLGEAIDLMSLVTAVVANDSGLMHIAAALNKPLVAIYGSTSPKFAPPLTKNKLRKLYLNLDCSPCKQRKCPLKHYQCLYDLTPELVLKSIADVANLKH